MRTAKIGNIVIVMTLLLFVVIQVGCVSENSRNCENGVTRELIIKVAGSDGSDITEDGEVEHAELFMFDKNGQFHSKIIVTEEQIRNRVPVNIDSGLSVVAWGNINAAEYVIYPDEEIGFEQAALHLALSDNGVYHQAPDDLFYGMNDYAGINRERKVVRDEIVISRKIANMNIEVRGLGYDIESEDYFFEIVHKNKGYNFNGELLSGETTLKETGVLDSRNNLVTPEPFNVMPTQPNDEDDIVEVRLIHRERGVLAVATADINGKPIKPVAGKTTNVLIVFTEAGFTIRIEVSDWDEVFQWHIE